MYSFINKNLYFELIICGWLSIKKKVWTGTCAGIALLMILQGELVNSYSGGSIDRMQWSKSSSSQKTTYVYTAYIRMVIRVVSLLHFALLKYYIKACYVENFQHIYFFQKQNQSNFCCPEKLSFSCRAVLS